MIFKRRTSFQFRHFRLSSKLIITYLLLTVVPLSLLGYISYAQYARSVEAQIGEYMPKILHQANEDIDKQIDELMRLPDLLFNSEQALSILRKETYAKRSEFNKDQYDMNSYLSRTYIRGNNANVIGVFILSNQRMFYSSKQQFKQADWQNTLSGYSEKPYSIGKAQFILPSEVDLQFDAEVPYLFIQKQIYDVDNRKVLGDMLIAVDLSFIDKIFHNFESSNRANLWLMSDAGEIIYHSDRSLIGTMDTEKDNYPLRSGSFRANHAGGAKLMSINTASISGWTLVHSIPLSELMQRTNLVRNVTILLFIAISVITSLIAVWISWSMTRPLKRLSGLMKTVEMGNFQVDLKVPHRDEIGMLARSFNSMVSTIRDLIQKNYQVELRQKEAELYALQSQINPHFLYNTLETIGMAVEEGETEAVVDMVTLLGRMFRFSVSNQSKWVTIAQEVQHAEDYLTIQKFRFEDRLAFRIDKKMTDSHFLQLFTPKFILQPVVENAIKHGLDVRRKMEVCLSVSEEFDARTGEPCIVFRVSDNGPGISSEKLFQLEEALKKDSFAPKSANFGLSNVNARIGMMLGNDYGIQLHSIEGIGTEVLIRIPLNERSD
ncbi:two-component system sensor histidine kinase YesM [Paenibacillus cellulosilyticus]|uniref:Two-component system sensor histidine kinase YesM n=1 Tax=Paenibacillus cellulosilyticus TaxID=375489 RepID=A0A2V2Z186_9BACL|nr:sensor histidine kinase [Paenibacillus cellulosilyticus]PWW07301.1 two-component system sensor histidine kinase YesM [Paenibacillus cellulosilyticus]QKS44512.1 sensor histidine kinase [Paenibacillus cellulosilyticus]